MISERIREKKIQYKELQKGKEQPRIIKICTQ